MGLLWNGNFYICVYLIFYIFTYIHMHTPHLLFPPPSLRRADGSCGGSGRMQGWRAALPPRPQAMRGGVALAVCLFAERCLVRSVAAQRRIVNTRVRVAAGGWAGRKTDCS